MIAGDLPSVELLVDVADGMLAETVCQTVAVSDRRSALVEELGWRVEVAAQDLDYARWYHSVAPVAGAEDQDYLDRWLQVSVDLWVLAGPRFRALDMELPFVGIVGANRAIVEGDLAALRRFARERFALFRPRYVCVWAGHPVGAWAGTSADSRVLAGRLGSLRAHSVPEHITARGLTDATFHRECVSLYEQHRAIRPGHSAQARPQPIESYAELVQARTAWSVLIDGDVAGFIAARPGAMAGCRGAEVVELVLAPRFCGHGYGRLLSLLLAQQMPQPDDQFLFGTIHVENHPAYRSACAAGRKDVGGEIIIPVQSTRQPLTGSTVPSRATDHGRRAASSVGPEI